MISDGLQFHDILLAFSSTCTILTQKVSENSESHRTRVQFSCHSISDRPTLGRVSKVDFSNGCSHQLSSTKDIGLPVHRPTTGSFSLRYSAPTIPSIPPVQVVSFGFPGADLGLAIFHVPCDYLCLRWEPNDELVLNAALCNRLRGDLQVSSGPRRYVVLRT